MARVLAAQPRVGLQEDDQRPDGEHAFDDAVHRRMAEHAAEEFAPRSRNKVHNHLHDHQAADHGRKAAACALPGHEVVEEHEDENRREGHFGPHQRKYRGVIHSRLTQNMCNDLRDAAADHVAHPQRRQPHAGDGDDEADDRQPLVPRGVRKLQVLGIVARAVEDFPDDAQDVDRRDDDRRAGDDGHHAVERVGVHKRAVEDGHFGHEAAQARQPEVGQTRDHIPDREERHHLHQPAQLADVPRVGAAVDCSRKVP